MSGLAILVQLTGYLAGSPLVLAPTGTAAPASLNAGRTFPPHLTEAAPSGRLFPCDAPPGLRPGCTRQRTSERTAGRAAA